MTYDWTKPNIERLLLDCLNGLKRAASGSTHHPYTFLGTIILTSDDSQEATFDGESLLIVDGQQRLTTLILLSCALFEAIRLHKHDIDNIPDAKLQEWLTKEADEQLDRLYRCTTGKQQSLSHTEPFPRMVRANDNRAHQVSESNYQSLIAELLYQFGEYCLSHDDEFSPTSNKTGSHLLKMFQHLRARIENFVYIDQSETEGQDDDFDPPVIASDDIFHTRLQKFIY